MQVQRDTADLLAQHFNSNGLVVRALQYAEDLDHIMDFTRLRALNSLFSMLNQLVRNVLNYNQTHPDFPMTVSMLCDMSFAFCLWSEINYAHVCTLVILWLFYFTHCKFS